MYRENRSIIADERKEARKQGIAEGIEQNKKDVILNMYNKNWDIKLISEGLNISTDKILEVINENKIDKK